MSTVLDKDAPEEIEETIADLVGRLGGIPLQRIRLKPAPGTAKEADVLIAEAAPRKRLCELIDGVLVEKAMAYKESLLASYLIYVLNQFVLPRNLGLVTGEQGMMRLWPGRVRMPDVAFVSWERLPGRTIPQDQIPDLAPDLAVEILSPSNTAREMELKLQDYFTAGSRLAWIVDPELQIVDCYTDATKGQRLTMAEALDGGTVLPGFTLPLAELFAVLERRG